MEAFGTTMDMSTPVSFTSGMSESFSYQPSSLTSYDSYTSIIPTPDASVGYITDEPTSPLSTTGTIFDMHDLIQNSPMLERSLSGFESNINFEGTSMPVVNSVIPMAPNPLNIQDDDSLDRNQATQLQNHILMAHGMSALNSRPSTRNSFSFASTTSSQNSLSVSELVAPSAEDSVEETGPSSPASSSGQTEGRDHEYYRRGVGPDGLYHCPLEGTECNFPPKSLKCEYHKHIDSHLKPFKCRHKDCSNQYFSSEACRLRHEREMHKMHNAKEHLCRYLGYCERKQTGNGFARSFNRGDHERRVHGMEPDNTRTKGRPKNSSATDTANISQAARKPSIPQQRTYTGLNTSDDSSTSTISSPVPRTGNAADAQSLQMPMTAPVAIPAPSYSRQQFMAPCSLPLGGPFGGHPARNIPPIPSLASMARRPSSGPSGVIKYSRKGRISPVSDKFHEYTRHVEKLQKLVANLPSIPDDTALQLERSIAEELDLLRRIHGDMDLPNRMVP